MNDIKQEQTKSLLPYIKSISKQDYSYDLNKIHCDTINYAISVGLGSILNLSIKSNSSLYDSNLQNALLGADLTAQVLNGGNITALLEILHADKKLAEDIILLKGISTSMWLYPKPYMRTMGDIDLLVSEKNQPKLEKLCAELGYSQQSDESPSFYENLHHSMPFYHPKKNVWIEVHTSLFPTSSPLSKESVFAKENTQAHVLLRKYEGHNVTHLDISLQLVYTCAHWAHEHNWGKGIIRIIDILYILNNTEQIIDWKKIYFWLNDSPVSANYLYLILSFFHKNELVNLPDELLNKVKKYTNGLNDLNLKLLHFLIETYLFKGQSFGKLLSMSNATIVWNGLLSPTRYPVNNLLSLPWKIIFPPQNPQRFSISFQMNRIKHLLFA